MKLTVISPEGDESRECGTLAALFDAGLERYHVRKPGWSLERLETWLRALPSGWRPWLVLHQHHELVASLGLGGSHWRDGGSAPSAPARGKSFTSRSCHDRGSLEASLGRYDAVFFGPMFPSISKPGHGPRPELSFSGLASLLDNRNPDARRTRVLALGGISAETAPRALAMGFDGVAALGAIWQTADPVKAFAELHNSLACHAA